MTDENPVLNKRLERILMVVPEMTGGWGRRVSTICNRFIATGVEVRLCLSYRFRLPVEYFVDECARTMFLTGKLLSVASTFAPGFGMLRDLVTKNQKLRLRRVLRSFRPKVIVVFDEKSAEMILSVKTAAAIPVVCGATNSIEDQSRRAGETFAGISGKLAGVVYQTGAQKEQYHRSFVFSESARHIVIPNPMEHSPLWDARVPERKKEIVAVGRVNKQKNYPLLLRAFAIVSERHPDWRLSIYGEPRAKREVLSLIEEHDLVDKVVMQGFHADVQGRINSASIYVMSSKYEGLPNALIEALCLGLPCVSTDFGGGGAGELITDGVNGLIVPNEDVNALAEALCRLIENPDFARQLGEKAKEARRKFDAGVIVDRWAGFLESVITN